VTKNKTLPLLRFYAMLVMGTGLIFIGLMLFIFLRDSSVSNRDFSTVPVRVDLPAPKLVLVDLAGSSVSLDEHLGSTVLVNLWATWCPPCKQEMPALQSFYEKYKGDGFIVLAIDQEETPEIVRPFVYDYGITFPVWIDEEYQAERAFNTLGLPSSYVIDRDGRVRLMWVGGISSSNLEKYVTTLIQE
jgi:cytochrome c biogenesis protein CcmG, thiol:disulfide interchange protein DsbE